MKKSKSKKYVSEENFNLLVESLNQAIEYERGERHDLRVTVLPAPPRTDSESAASRAAIKAVLTQELDRLSEASLKQMVDYVAFLKFRERSNQLPQPDESRDGLSLEEMLALITEDNKHGEIDFGPPVGKEV